MALLRQNGRIDSFGRVVDSYVKDQRVTVLTLNVATIEEVYDQLCRIIRGIFDSIAVHSNARLRSRRFTTFYCQWPTRMGRDVVALGLSYRLDSRLFRLFYDELRKRFGQIECDSGQLGDVQGVPIFRYENGTTIRYVGPVSSTPNDDVSLEIRSYDLYRPRRHYRAAPVTVPEVRTGAPARHSFDEWKRMRHDVLHLFHEMRLPASYHRFRAELERQFGFTVREAAGSSLRRNGYITVDWVTDREGSCTVTIVVARDLPAPLKYLVLAHELAHYALHFPLIFAAQEIEQLSWISPGVESKFRDIVQRVLPQRQELEYAADELATYAVLPIWYDRDWDFVYDVDRTPTTEQMMWGGLQSFFPDTRENEDFTMFRTREAMLDRERTELLRAASDPVNDRDGLYRVILSAALRRSSETSKSRNHALAESVHEVFGRSREIAVEQSVPLGEHEQAESPAVFGETEPTPRRHLFQPLSGFDESARVRWPIVPNDKSRSSWLSVLQPDLTSMTLNEWRAYLPHVSIVTYPYKELPATPIGNFFLDDPE